MQTKFDNLTEAFWTDSKIVLGYLTNGSRRFHVYVANRVQKIRDHTAVSQQLYRSSDMLVRIPTQPMNMIDSFRSLNAFLPGFKSRDL